MVRPHLTGVPVHRVLPLIAILVIAACSRNNAQANSTNAAAAPGQAPAGQTAAGQPPAAQTENVKPVPAQLPEVVARVNGEAITKGEFERAVQNLEGRAGGPVPADQRDRIYRGVLD